MRKQHEVLAVERIPGAYGEVRDALLADPLGILQRATCTVLGGLFGAKLRAIFGPLEVGSEIVVDLTSIEEGPPDEPATRLSIDWGAMRWPDAFPTMHATLSLYPLRSGETVIELYGTYLPPLGRVGAAADSIAMHRVAKESAVHFVRDVARHLGSMMAEARPL